MSRLRLAARFRWPRSSSSCSFQAAPAPPFLDDPSSLERISSTPSVGRDRAPSLLKPRLLPSGSTVGTPGPATLLSPPLSNSVSVRASEAHHQPVIELNYIFAQGPSSRCLHSFSGLSSKHMISENDQNDGQSANPSMSENPLVDPGVREVEAAISDRYESLEDEAKVDKEEFSSTCSSSEPSGSRSTVVYEAEVMTEFYSSSAKSTDESDLSELEFGEGDSRLHNNRENQFRAGEEEETQWTAFETDHIAILEASERTEYASERIRGFGVLGSSFNQWCVQEDPGEGNLKVSDRHACLNRRPYLHVLSSEEVCEILEKARAKDVRTLYVRECCDWADELVFASGRSSRHLRGMADAIVYKVKRSSENVGPNSFPTVEGRDGEQWMAVDCGNIVIHLFLEEARSYYDLEALWRKKSNPRHVSCVVSTL